MKKIAFIFTLIFMQSMAVEAQIIDCTTCDESITVTHTGGCNVLLMACNDGEHEWYLDQPDNNDLFIGTEPILTYTVPGPGTYSFWHYTICPDNSQQLKSDHISVTIGCDDCAPSPEDIDFSFEPTGRDDEGCFFEFQAEYTGNANPEFIWTIEGGTPNSFYGESPDIFFPLGTTTSEVCLQVDFGGSEECILEHCETIDIDCSSCEESIPENLACEIEDNMITLTWDPVFEAFYYVINIYPNDNDCPCAEGFPQVPSSLISLTNSITFDMQDFGECFSWQVRALCHWGGSTPFSEKECFDFDEGCGPDPCDPYDFDIAFTECNGFAICLG